MFRSLFIGFLILSALISKGAEVQINQNITNISRDMLLELLNASIFHADKQVELSVMGSDEVFFSRHSENRCAIEELLRPIRHSSPVIWAEPADEYNCTNLQYTNVKLQQKQFCSSNVSFCSSDISPPSFRQV